MILSWPVFSESLGYANKLTSNIISKIWNRVGQWLSDTYLIGPM